MVSYRTPRSRAAGLGTAKEGVHTWIAERVSAIALVPLSLWAVYAALRSDGVRASGEHLGQHGHVEAGACQLQRGAHAGAACTDDHDVEFALGN